MRLILEPANVNTTMPQLHHVLEVFFFNDIQLYYSELIESFTLLSAALLPFLLSMFKCVALSEFFICVRPSEFLSSSPTHIFPPANFHSLKFCVVCFLFANMASGLSPQTLPTTLELANFGFHKIWQN